jgi:hypothetical protein
MTPQHTRPSPASIAVSGEAGIVAHPTVSWALDRLRDACRAAGIAFSDRPDGEGRTLIALRRADGFTEDGEGFAVQRRPQGLTITARGPRGFSYALTELAALVCAGTDYEHWEQDASDPAVPVRGIARAFSSIDEDEVWLHDRDFWTGYLDELASNRFNRFHLALGMQFNYGTIDAGEVDNYLAFAYPFLVEVPGYAVRAEGVTSAERDRNLSALRHIAQQARRRGLQFSLGLWTHAYAFPAPTRHRYPIIGVSEENHAPYCAAALRKLLTEIPEIDALTFRAHFEAGIAEARQELFWEPIFAAIADSGRHIAVDLHAKGVGPDLLAAAARHGLRITLSGKYWAEHLGLPYHQTTIRPQETARPAPAGETMSTLASYSRLFTRYGYADYLKEDSGTDFMFRMWPGTQKLLLWGDPAFAAGYGRYATFGGSRGVEFCEPLFFKGRKRGTHGRRDPYVRDDLRLSAQDWRKYRYTYLLWGRLLYDPDAPPETWRRLLRADYGDAAEAVEKGLGALSRILPLVSVVHGVGGANNLYWPEIYVDLPVSAWLHTAHYDKRYEWDNSSPQNWGRVSPFDPAMFYGIDEYVRAVIDDRQDGRYTPLEVARWIDDMVTAGEAGIAALQSARGGDPAQQARAEIDMKVLVRLGRFFAGKFRAAVNYAVFELTRDGTAIAAAAHELENARIAFAEIPGVVEGCYQNDLVFGTELSERGHWSMRLPAIDDDLRVIRLERDRSTPDPRNGFAATRARMRTQRSLSAGLRHDPRPFKRGAAQTIRLDAGPEVTGVTLHARPVDQSARFQRIAMTRDGDAFTGAIPAGCIGTGYPVMYYFELALRDGPPMIYPGFEADLANQPYFSTHGIA